MHVPEKHAKTTQYDACVVVQADELSSGAGNSVGNSPSFCTSALVMLSTLLEGRTEKKMDLLSWQTTVTCCLHHMPQ